MICRELISISLSTAGACLAHSHECVSAAAKHDPDVSVRAERSSVQAANDPRMKKPPALRAVRLQFDHFGFAVDRANEPWIAYRLALEAEGRNRRNRTRIAGPLSHAPDAAPAIGRSGGRASPSRRNSSSPDLHTRSKTAPAQVPEQTGPPRNRPDVRVILERLR